MTPEEKRVLAGIKRTAARHGVHIAGDAIWAVGGCACPAGDVLSAIATAMNCVAAAGEAWHLRGGFDSLGDPLGVSVWWRDGSVILVCLLK